MPSRRSILSCAVAPALLAGGLAPSRAAAAPASPEFVGIDGWLNTDRPLAVAGLRGKVALVEFCTYTCINWRRTLPYVNRWHSEYGPQGLQVIGIHTPEFGFERIRPNVESAIRELDVRYPIAQDNAVPDLARMGQPGLAVVLPSGRSWPGPPCARRRGACAGDGSRHPRPARAGARRLDRTSGRRCRPLSHPHTGILFRRPASHAARPRAVAPPR